MECKPWSEEEFARIREQVNAIMTPEERAAEADKERSRPPAKGCPRGRGRGSRYDNRRRGWNHVRNAIRRFREAGPECADLVDRLEQALKSMPKL
jgi:hypothetical protein